MEYLANYGGYGMNDDSTEIWVAGLGFLAIGLILGYVLGAGRVPGIKPPKKRIRNKNQLLVSSCC